ncbi:hypothetical protein SCP_1403830 [Sparassis crispa]|uniref:Uncharacterized protein n=1 Tax=Sparassis crispa TaxID=139825 RepID=A0A401H3F7_9APHY|nr:hypothetical protein SCP_1403830 [Sparassis crispa]GBE88975.1 hypothetical protein SCP_1403830 [Sparassis crispa]
MSPHAGIVSAFVDARRASKFPLGARGVPQTRRGTPDHPHPYSSTGERSKEQWEL